MELYCGTDGDVRHWTFDARRSKKNLGDSEMHRHWPQGCRPTSNAQRRTSSIQRLTSNVQHLDSALALDRISKRFRGVLALDGASITVRRGTVHALLGENGAGKTTLMRVAYGMLRPDAGRVLVDGTQRRLRSSADAIRAGVGMVHQHYALVAPMTVAENVALGGHGRYDARASAAQVRALAHDTGLALDPDARVDDLSVEAQQRVEIVKALARDVHTLILDEPTAVLAPSTAATLLTWLRQFADAGHAVVLITHKLREALGVADDITVLRHGRTVLSTSARSTSEEGLANAMLGSAPAGRESRR